MLKRLVVGGASVFIAVALVVGCSSNSKSSSGSGGSGGSSGSGGGSGGTATGGTGGGAQDGGGGAGGTGGTTAYADADLDAPYQLPDGGCGQIFCPAAVAASCSKGFASNDECAKFCTKVAQTACESQWNALLTCAGPSPSISCDSSGIISVAGCATEQQAFATCFASDGGV